MLNISNQIDYEKRYVRDNAERYYRKQDKIRGKDSDVQVDSASYIIRSGVLEVAGALEDIANRLTRGIGGKYNRLLKRAAARVDSAGEVYYDYGAVAYIGLSCVFHSFSHKQGPEWSHVAHTIATRLEADHKARLFELHEPAYFHRVMQSFNEQMVQQYQHKHRVIMMKFNEFDIKWQAWDANEKIQIANKILLAITIALPDVFFRHVFYDKKNKKKVLIDTTPEADLWFAEFEKERGFLQPSHPPLLVPPLDWVRDEGGQVTGGYHTLRMAASLPFVKAHSREHREFIAQHEMTEHINAINKLQHTSWCINADVLKIQQDMFKLQLGNGLPRYEPQELPLFPEHIAGLDSKMWTDNMKEEVQAWKVVSKRIHTQNRVQKGKVIVYKMIADMAREFAKHTEFFFGYNADFRGRIYCATTGLSPQGEDLAKALLQFSTGVRHGKAGLYWLAVHGANTFGHDKISNEERVSWVYKNTGFLRRIAEDPLSTRGDWAGADKPWQFLAFVLEWANTDYGNNTDSPGFLPIGLDGSCNGLQHYSALLRDSVGARAVNLIDAQVPSDIYGEVATTLRSNLLQEEAGDTEALRQVWLKAGFDRKLTKRPVMTLPYGSTQQSAKEYIYDWILNNRQKMNCPDTQYFTCATWLTPHLWKSIGEVVIAARAGMSWLQRMATRVLRRTGKPIRWISPAGFPVYQDYRKKRTVRINTVLMGSIEARIQVSSLVDTQEIDKVKQRNAIAPNFVHSLDSSHMVKVINTSPLTHFAMIHDDFGVHAGHTESFWWTIRKEFVWMYTEKDILANWRDQQGIEDPIELPPKGTLDIQEVLDSTYFFG